MNQLDRRIPMLLVAICCFCANPMQSLQTLVYAFPQASLTKPGPAENSDAVGTRSYERGSWPYY